MTIDVDLDRALVRADAREQQTAYPAGQGTAWWWDQLDAPARKAAIRVATCGGYLPTELAVALVHAGVAILMPDDVRKYIQHQVAISDPDRFTPR